MEDRVHTVVERACNNNSRRLLKSEYLRAMIIYREAA